MRDSELCSDKFHCEVNIVLTTHGLSAHVSLVYTNTEHKHPHTSPLLKMGMSNHTLQSCTIANLPKKVFTTLRAILNLQLKQSGQHKHVLANTTLGSCTEQFRTWSGQYQASSRYTEGDH